MSPNTRQRIISAIVLILVVIGCVYWGRVPSLTLVFLIGVVAIDEIFTNFFKKPRKNVFYYLSQAVFILPFVYFNILEQSPDFLYVFVNAGVLVNILLILYLFFSSMHSKIPLNLAKTYPFISGVFILLPLMSLAFVFQFSKWRLLLTVLFIVNFGMDTGAWFFGKNFGKHKLWPSVSPKKTVEGLIGGAFTAGILGSICWQLLFDKVHLGHILFFIFLGIISQVGDLIQSKLKRTFEIKDSSALIPGHGGVYDRVDSLLFLSPFYASVLKYFYFN